MLLLWLLEFRRIEQFGHYKKCLMNSINAQSVTQIQKLNQVVPASDFFCILSDSHKNKALLGSFNKPTD